MTTGKAPESAKTVARHVRGVLGGDSVVEIFYDEKEQNSVFVASAVDSPMPGWTTCTTVSLHLVPNLLDGKDLRVELMATARTEDTALANVVATAAFFVAKNGWLAAPGVVFPDQVREYFPDTTTPHLMWSEPVNHPELSTVELAGAGSVHWLLAVPLTEEERLFLAEHGYFELEERLSAAEAEYFDLWRSSAV